MSSSSSEKCVVKNDDASSFVKDHPFTEPGKTSSNSSSSSSSANRQNEKSVDAQLHSVSRAHNYPIGESMEEPMGGSNAAPGIAVSTDVSRFTDTQTTGRYTSFSASAGLARDDSDPTSSLHSYRTTSDADHRTGTTMSAQPPSFQSTLPQYFEAKNVTLQAPAAVGKEVKEHVDIVAEDEQSNTNLFVRNLHRKVDDSKLHDIFAPFGSIVSSTITRDIHTGESKGMGFVRYKTAAEARLALSELTDFVVLGKTMYVQWAKKQHDNAPIGDARKKIHKLFLRNVPMDVTTEQLVEMFCAYGGLRSITIHKDTAPCAVEGMERHIAFVVFVEDGCADKAAEAVHNTKPFISCHGIPIMVKLAEDQCTKNVMGDVNQKHVASYTAGTGGAAPRHTRNGGQSPFGDQGRSGSTSQVHNHGRNGLGPGVVEYAQLAGPQGHMYGPASAMGNQHGHTSSAGPQNSGFNGANSSSSIGMNNTSGTYQVVSGPYVLPQYALAGATTQSMTPPQQFMGKMPYAYVNGLVACYPQPIQTISQQQQQQQQQFMIPQYATSPSTSYSSMPIMPQQQYTQLFQFTQSPAPSASAPNLHAHMNEYNTVSYQQVVTPQPQQQQQQQRVNSVDMMQHSGFSVTDGSVRQGNNGEQPTGNYVDPNAQFDARGVSPGGGFAGENSRSISIQNERQFVSLGLPVLGATEVRNTASPCPSFSSVGIFGEDRAQNASSAPNLQTGHFAFGENERGAASYQNLQPLSPFADALSLTSQLPKFSHGDSLFTRNAPTNTQNTFQTLEESFSTNLKGAADEEKDIMGDTSLVVSAVLGGEYGENGLSDEQKLAEIFNVHSLGFGKDSYDGF